MYREFGLEVDYQQYRQRMESSTNLKDVNDPIKLRSPGGNCVFVFLRVENTRDKISFVRFNGTPLNLRHGPAIETW